MAVLHPVAVGTAHACQQELHTVLVRREYCPLYRGSASLIDPGPPLYKGPKGGNAMLLLCEPPQWHEQRLPSLAKDYC